jgi:hypothetical protein
MINYHEAKIQALAGHVIQAHNDAKGDIIYSQQAVSVGDDLQRSLLHYFLSHFKEPDYYEFTFPSGDVMLNPVYNFVSNIFDDPACIHEQSVKIAKQLLDKSSHPNIKSGELVIAYIDRILIDDELVEAVAIFKSESKESILKVGVEDKDLYIHEEFGTSTTKIDKGCLVFNTDRDTGYKVCSIDHSNRNRDALYWKDDFLILRAKSSDYLSTKEYINATKNFIKERLPKEFDTDRADEAEMMHRSQEYFKNHEEFDAFEYEQRVFRDNKVVEAFQDYKQDYQDIKGTTLPDIFDISDQAVKKQSRVFKSIIKLDRNFHIYVHGDRQKIQKGTDEDGNKYYILYYNDES